MLTSGHYLLIWDIHVLSKDNIYTVAHGHEYLYCQYKYIEVQCVQDGRGGFLSLITERLNIFKHFRGHRSHMI